MGCPSASKPGVRSPPSLVNIYKELHGDLGILPAPARLSGTLGAGKVCFCSTAC